MTLPSISTARRLEYAQGYIALGLLVEAADELAAIAAVDQHADAVLELSMDLFSQQQRWDLTVSAAQEYARRHPKKSHGWISWAFALRRLTSIREAESVLLAGEKHLGETCALIHYNLACYRCQLGDHTGALRRLSVAFRMEPHWHAVALNDPDLTLLRSDIEALSPT